MFILSLLDFVIKRDKIYTLLFACVALFFVLYAGLRTCSIDYEGYRYNFDLLNSVPLSDIYHAGAQVEPAYAILNIMLGNFETVLFIMALANVLVLFPFFRKYSPYPFVTLLFYAGLFLYSGMMGLIRQSIAIAICLWAMAEPKNRRFFWLIAIAMTFHVSAIIVAIVRVVKNNFYRIQTYLLVIAIAVVANLMFYELFYQFVSLLPPFLKTKLEFYLGVEEGLRFGLNEAVMIRLFTFILAFAYKDKIVRVFPKGALFVNIYFLALVIYIGFGFLPQMAARGAVYFHYMELIVVPMILYVANRMARIPIFLLYAGFSLVRHITMIETHAEYYIPYTNLLFDLF